MGKKGKRREVVIKELPPKIKIIRQITEQERKDSSNQSGLEKKEEEIEKEISRFSNPVPSSNSNFLLQSSITPQQTQRTNGNTSIQQRPQEDSDEVKKWYSQSTRLAPGRDAERYRLPSKQDLTQQQDNLRRSTIGANQELQSLGGSSLGDDDKYNLVKPEKKESRRKYPWEV